MGIIELPDTEAIDSGVVDRARRGTTRAARAAKSTDPVVAEYQRLTSIAAKLGRRLAYATSTRALGPPFDACEACGRPMPGAMPDKDVREQLRDYRDIVLGLVREQRARVELVCKYNLEPQMTDDELQERIVELVQESIDTMTDEQLAAALDRRKAARAGELVVP